jgi:hypothetical protein
LSQAIWTTIYFSTRLLWNASVKALLRQLLMGTPKFYPVVGYRTKILIYYQLASICINYANFCIPSRGDTRLGYSQAHP